jgi:hypothetical protein
MWLFFYRAEFEVHRADAFVTCIRNKQMLDLLLLICYMLYLYSRARLTNNEVSAGRTIYICYLGLGVQIKLYNTMINRQWAVGSECADRDRAASEGEGRESGALRTARGARSDGGVEVHSGPGGIKK